VDIDVGAFDFGGDRARRKLDFQEKTIRLDFKVIDLIEEDQPAPANLPRPEVIIIDDEEARIEVDLFGPHVSPEQLHELAKREPSPLRNPPIIPPFTKIKHFKWNNSFLKPGKTVSLKDDSFLHITKVIQNQETDIVTLRGWQLKRNRDFDGSLPKQKNELCYIHEVDMDDDRPMLEQSVIEVKLDQVLKIRRLVLTNKLFPECRFDRTQLPQGDNEFLGKHIEDEELLVARRRYITEYKDARSRENQAKIQVNYTRKLIRKLTIEECTPGYTDTPEQQRFQWRGDTTLGGSAVGSENRRDCVCEICLRSYDRVERLRNHEPEHDGEKKQPRGKVDKIWPWMEEKEKKFFERGLGALPGNDRGSHHSTSLPQRNSSVASRQQYTFGDSCKYFPDKLLSLLFLTNKLKSAVQEA